jgi:hypothetical protein
MRSLCSESIGRSELGGFGQNIVKIRDSGTGETLCYIGKVNGEDRVHFAKASSPEAIIALAELLKKSR